VISPEAVQLFCFGTKDKRNKFDLRVDVSHGPAQGSNAQVSPVGLVSENLERSDPRMGDPRSTTATAATPAPALSLLEVEMPRSAASS
jgi:hypothetical protein